MRTNATRVVAITGASAGVGRATARAFAKKGAAVGLIARASKGLGAARAEIERLHARTIAVAADVSDAEAVEGAAQAIEDTLGPIDVWVNNAMVSVFSPVKEMTADEFRRVTEVTYLGYVYGTMSALKRMLPRDHGCVIQVGSALAYRAIPLQAAYCAAKHAIEGFTESLRCELLHDRSSLRITQVNLPALNTPQFEWVRTRLLRHPQPIPPIYQPELAADAIVWASEHRRREVNVAGSTVATLIGNKFVPRLLDRYLARTGYDSQQEDGAVEPGRPDNLYAPVEGNHAVRGHFGARASHRSLQWWISKNRNAAGIAAAALAGAGMFTRRR